VWKQSYSLAQVAPLYLHRMSHPTTDVKTDPQGEDQNEDPRGTADWHATSCAACSPRYHYFANPAHNSFEDNELTERQWHHLATINLETAWGGFARWTVVSCPNLEHTAAADVQCPVLVRSLCEARQPSIH
jgi:hypothetical protein